uniref:Orotate phosphoribosyltransferase n=1 Tax=Desulfobacca acetoxidans TaxID=60893 RepID=A0A7C3V1R2_9BACT
MEQKKARLLHLLQEKSFRYSPEAPFKLASGRESPYYVDCRPVTHSAEGLALTGEIIFDLVKDQGVDALGGLTMGADPLAHAAALISYQRGRPINAFSVRKFHKGYGAGGRLVGPVQPGQRVVVLEDVITTGGSVLEAVNAVRQFGLQVEQVIVLVDREEGGRQAVAAQVPRVEAVFTLSQLRRNY